MREGGWKQRREMGEDCGRERWRERLLMEIEEGVAEEEEGHRREKCGREVDTGSGE